MLSMQDIIYKGFFTRVFVYFMIIQLLLGKYLNTNYCKLPNRSNWVSLKFSYHMGCVNSGDLVEFSGIAHVSVF